MRIESQAPRSTFDRLLGRVLPVSRKGSIHRFYVRRGGETGWGLFVHRIVRSDAEGVFHNHPWNGIALIFGSYTEETPHTPLQRRRGINLIYHRVYHRVEITRPTWTIFLHFKRLGDWQFRDRSSILATNLWRGPDA